MFTKIHLWFICHNKCQYIYRILCTAIGNAVAILTDVEKRKQYDMYGSEEDRLQNAHGRQNHSHYNYTRGFESTIKIHLIFC